jgi:hypothetical protein
MKEDGQREVRKSSGHAGEPAIQVICLVSNVVAAPEGPRVEADSGPGLRRWSQ